MASARGMIGSGKGKSEEFLKENREDAKEKEKENADSASSSDATVKSRAVIGIGKSPENNKSESSSSSSISSSSSNSSSSSSSSNANNADDESSIHHGGMVEDEDPPDADKQWETTLPALCVLQAAKAGLIRSMNVLCVRNKGGGFEDGGGLPHFFNGSEKSEGDCSTVPRLLAHGADAFVRKLLRELIRHRFQAHAVPQELVKDSPSHFGLMEESVRALYAPLLEANAVSPLEVLRNIPLGAMDEARPASNAFSAVFQRAYDKHRYNVGEINPTVMPDRFIRKAERKSTVEESVEAILTATIIDRHLDKKASVFSENDFRPSRNVSALKSLPSGSGPQVVTIDDVCHANVTGRLPLAGLDPTASRICFRKTFLRAATATWKTQRHSEAAEDAGSLAASASSSSSTNVANTSTRVERFVPGLAPALAAAPELEDDDMPGIFEEGTNRYKVIPTGQLRWGEKRKRSLLSTPFGPAKRVFAEAGSGSALHLLAWRLDGGSWAKFYPGQP